MTKWRHEAGWLQADVAEKSKKVARESGYRHIGISARTVRRIERGECIPREHTLLALMYVFGRRIEEAIAILYPEGLGAMLDNDPPMCQIGERDVILTTEEARCLKTLLALPVPRLIDVIEFLKQVTGDQ